MLNRRILRIKAFKVLFSYAENPSMTLAEAESQLQTSCEATRSLYLFMLGIIPYVTQEAATRIENAGRKFNPTEEEKKGFNPMSNSSLESTSLIGLGWRGCFNAEAGFTHTVQILKETYSL